MLSSASTILISSHLIAPTLRMQSSPFPQNGCHNWLWWGSKFPEKSPLAGATPGFCQHLCPLKNVIKALSQLFCPQSIIHGCSGLAIDPATYLLLEGTAFLMPMDPGAMAAYPQWATPTTVKMIDATFIWDKNYFLSYRNITRACFHMFNANFATQFKVSNTPSLTGWNSKVSINVILNQLRDSYGKQNMVTLLNNDTLFWSPTAPTDSPEMLFYCIKQCREIQHIGKLPYSDDQIIANAISILIQANIFPIKEFDTWEALATKMYPTLKTFFHKAYGQHLTAMALRSTSVKNGYATHNMY
jgi:hypothetical protein